MDKTRIWVIAASIVMAGILALGWFTGIDPQLKAKAASDQERASVEAQNEATELAIATLKGDYENIEALRAELARLRTSIPATGNMPAFLTQLDNLSKASNATVTTLTVDEAVEYTAPATAIEAAPVEPANPEADATTDATVAPVEEAPEAPSVITDPRITAENFVVIPVSIVAAGDKAGVRSLVDKLQHGPRLFLATQVSIVDDVDAGTSTTTIGGFVYVLLQK